MSANFNKVILAGNLTRDPEMRFIASGAGVTKFGLAVNRRSKGAEETLFVDIIAWDRTNYKLAGICNDKLRSGTSVLVEGRLVIRSYDDREGNKRKATEVVIDTMQILDRASAAAAAAAGADDDDDGLIEDEVPF